MPVSNGIPGYKLIDRGFLLLPILLVWAISIGTVSYLSLTPAVELPFGFKWDDKVYHAFAYLWLSVLPLLCFQRRKFDLAGALMMAPFGILIEFAQRFVPGRHFSLGDMIANIVGVILGILLVKYLKSYFGVTQEA